MVNQRDSDTTFFILPIILLAIAFTVLLLTLYPYYQIKPVPKYVPTPTPTVTPTKIIQKWQTYRNDKFGFEFSYLANNNLNESDSGKLWLTLSTYSVLVEKLKSIGADSFKTVPKVGTIVINNVIWDIYHSPDGGGDHGEGERNAYIASNNTYQYTFYGFNQDSKSIIEETLSTFKFLTIPTPTKAITKFTCPKSGWVDCMPGPGPTKQQCQTDFLQWATKNCPGFQGAAL